MRLPGSEHVPLRGSRVLRGRADGRDVWITLRLRARSSIPHLSDDPALETTLPAHRVHAAPEELAARHGADPTDVAHVAAWARRSGLDVVETSAPGRRVKIRGTLERVARLFGVTPVHYAHPRRSHRGYTGAIEIPDEIAPHVASVHGLSDRPCARPGVAARPGSAKVGGASALEIPDLAAIYGFPAVPARTAMPTISVVELGGGFHRADLEYYFKSVSLPVPEIVTVTTGGRSGRNSPAPEDDLHALQAMLMGKGGTALEGTRLDRALWTFETTMDLQILGALAPGAKLVVHFAKDDDQGIVEALTRALLEDPHGASVVSMSWSEPEPDLPVHVIEATHDVLAHAAHLGVTLCGSAGDQGSANGGADGQASVSFPASSPYVLACGGTTLHLEGKRLRAEDVWNARFHGRQGATGGGVSVRFPRPRWQADLSVPARADGGDGRGVPDVAANADPATGCRIVVGGRDTVTSGTSAASPLWAALVARLQASLGHRTGYLTPLLYRLARERAGLLRDVVHGSNGAYHAAKGWDACTGWGSPNGTILLEALQGTRR